MTTAELVALSCTQSSEQLRQLQWTLWEEGQALQRAAEQALRLGDFVAHVRALAELQRVVDQIDRVAVELALRY